MPADAGTVYAEIRIATDKLQGDIAKMNGIFSGAGKGVDEQAIRVQYKATEMSKKVNESFGSMAKTGVNQFAKMARGIQAAFMALPIVGLITMIIGGITKAVGGLGEWLAASHGAYIKHNEELAKMNAVLQSTGSSAWTSARQLAEQAKQLGENSKFAQNEIMQMQSVLLGFKSITGSVFNETSQAIVNMAAVMGGDLAGAANTVGKALDDPVNGLGALSRNGFVFTQAQKDMIAEMVSLGDKAGAQKIIIDEMNASFGGAAAAVSSVTTEQARLAENMERVNRAQGESTQGLAAWWARLRANIKGALADYLEFNNAVLKAANPDYSEQESRLEHLKGKIAGVTDEWERINLEDQIKKLQLEIDLSRTTDQLVLAQNQFKKYEAQMSAYGHTIDITADATYQALLREVTVREAVIKAIKEDMAVADEAAAVNARRAEAEQTQIELNTSMEDKLAVIEKNRMVTLEETQRLRDAGIITAEEQLNRITGAYLAEANAINQLRTEVDNLGKAISEERHKELEGKLGAAFTEAADKHAEAFGRMAKNEKKALSAEELIKRRDAMVLIFENIEKTNSDMLARGIIDEEEYDKRILAARKQLTGSIQSMMEEAGLQFSDNPVTAKIFEENIELIDIQTAAMERTKQARKDLTAVEKASEGMDKTIEDLNFQYIQLTGSTKEIEEAEKARARAAVYSSQAYQDLADAPAKLKEALDAGIISAEEYEKQLAKVTQQLYDVEEGLTAVEKAGEKNVWKKLTAGVQQYGSQAAGIISAGFQLYADSVKRETEALKAELEKRYAMQKENLDKELQARLYAMGYIEAATAEQHERELELAIESGDQQRIFEAHSNAERFAIEEEYAEKQRELEEESARQRAQLEYKAALAQWQGQLANALSSVALAVVQAAVNKWPLPAVPMMALAGSLGAAQVALISANKPKMQAFADGGIVGGNSFRGDSTLIRANAGEMVLNPQQQGNMFEAINNNQMGGDVNATIVIMLDGKEIARNTVQRINRREQLIEAGSVVE